MSSTLDHQSPDVSSVGAKDAAYAVMAGFLGWALDAFDFFLVVVSLTYIGKDLGVGDTAMAWSITITLFFRPVGALIFGLLADRYGRRIPMMIDLIFYSAVEVATGFVHSFWAFMVLRALFGIGMGGEWGVGTSLVMEKVSPKWRGLLSGLLQEGYAFGCLMASVAAYFFLDVNKAGSWRPLFWLGGAPALLALFIRFFVKESEVWEKSKAESWSQLGAALKSNWKLWLYLTLLMAMMNFSSHGTQDLFPTFLKKDKGFDQSTVSIITSLAMVGAIAGGLVFGFVSDRYGRRFAMVVAFALAICVVPLWAFSPTVGLLTLGAFLLQFMVQGAWGVIPAHISELSPDNVRGFLPGFSYQCGNLIACAIPVISTSLAAHIGYPKAMALLASTIFAFAIVVTLLGKERRGVTFGAPEHIAPGRGFEPVMKSTA